MRYGSIGCIADNHYDDCRATVFPVSATFRLVLVNAEAGAWCVLSGGVVGGAGQALAPIQPGMACPLRRARENRCVSFCRALASSCDKLCQPVVGFLLGSSSDERYLSSKSKLFAGL